MRAVSDVGRSILPAYQFSSVKSSTYLDDPVFGRGVRGGGGFGERDYFTEGRVDDKYKNKIIIIYKCHL